MKRIPLLAWTLTLCGANLASAGVYVEMVDRNTATQTTKLSQKMYVQGGSGRIVDDEGLVTIVKNDTMYVIDNAKKTYSVFDQATMDDLAKQLNAATAQMKEQMAKLPPAERAQMEQMMSSHLPGMGGDGKKWVVEVTDTGKSDKVEGRTCRIWDVKRNGELDEQLCVVPYSSLPGKENFQAVFSSFAKAFEQMAKSVPALSGAMSTEFDAQAKINGFPVRARSYERGRLVNEEQIMKVWREEAIPASMFEVPAGYKRRSPLEQD